MGEDVKEGLCSSKFGTPFNPRASVHRGGSLTPGGALRDHRRDDRSASTPARCHQAPIARPSPGWLLRCRTRTVMYHVPGTPGASLDRLPTCVNVPARHGHIPGCRLPGTARPSPGWSLRCRTRTLMCHALGSPGHAGAGQGLMSISDDKISPPKPTKNHRCERVVNSRQLRVQSR